MLLTLVLVCFVILAYLNMARVGDFKKPSGETIREIGLVLFTLTAIGLLAFLVAYNWPQRSTSYSSVDIFNTVMTPLLVAGGFYLNYRAMKEQVIANNKQSEAININRFQNDLNSAIELSKSISDYLNGDNFSIRIYNKGRGESDTVKGSFNEISEKIFINLQIANSIIRIKCISREEIKKYIHSGNLSWTAFVIASELRKNGYDWMEGQHAKYITEYSRSNIDTDLHEISSLIVNIYIKPVSICIKNLIGNNDENETIFSLIMINSCKGLTAKSRYIIYQYMFHSDYPEIAGRFYDFLFSGANNRDFVKLY